MCSLKMNWCEYFGDTNQLKTKIFFETIKKLEHGVLDGI